MPESDGDDRQLSRVLLEVEAMLGEHEGNRWRSLRWDAVHGEAHTVAGDVVRDMRPMLTKSALRIVHDPDAAEDVVQSALVRVLSRRMYNDNPSQLRAVLPGIVRNVAANTARRMGRDPFSYDSVRHIDSEAARYWGVVGFPDERTVPLVETQQRALVDALRALPSSDRDVVVLRFLRDYTVPEISETLAMSNRAVRLRLRKALRRLLKQLETRADVNVVEDSDQIEMIGPVVEAANPADEPEEIIREFLTNRHVSGEDVDQAAADLDGLLERLFLKLGPPPMDLLSPAQAGAGDE